MFKTALVVMFSVMLTVSIVQAESVYLPLIARGETIPPVDVNQQTEQRDLQDTVIQYLIWTAMGEGYINDLLTPPHMPDDVAQSAEQIGKAMEDNYVFSTQMNVVRYFVHVYRTDSPDNASLSPLPNKIETLCRDLAVLIGADNQSPVWPDQVDPAQVDQD